MSHTKTIFSRSPSGNAVNNVMIDLIRHFKYELVKVLVFLVLLAACVIYTSSESKAYYKTNIESGIAR